MLRVKVSYAPSVRRLPSYLHIIRQAERGGDFYISGTVIAQELNLEPIQVRKDLAITGIVGKPKKGYPVEELIKAIERYLGWDLNHDAVLVGAGNLGSALIGYQEFQRHGLHIVAAFDTDPQKIGGLVHGVSILDMKDLETRIKAMGAEIAILTVPSPFAQATAEILVRAGITSIWNFTNTKLKVPDYVVVQREDLSSGYAMLSVQMLSRKARA
jgi:redox-sensing transcriptional repressor